MIGTIATIATDRWRQQTVETTRTRNFDRHIQLRSVNSDGKHQALDQLSEIDDSALLGGQSKYVPQTETPFWYGRQPNIESIN